MWNHLTTFKGRANESKMSTYIVDRGGRVIPTAKMTLWEEYPYYDDDRTRSDSSLYYKLRSSFQGPARKAGESFLILDPTNMYEKGRTAYQYLPGQRRVKLAPEIGFDTPDTSTGGITIYDETFMFNGSMDRYIFKLVGKKEMYIPYNCYKTSFGIKGEELCGPKHLNPNIVRWELHRVWVVEATLRPGKRHIYSKRYYYLDEDSWAISAAESYDSKGYLNKVNFSFQIPLYDVPAPFASFLASYNMISDNYSLYNWVGDDGYVRPGNPRPERAWTPESLASGVVR
jgi:hypothetical protein